MRLVYTTIDIMSPLDKIIADFNAAERCRGPKKALDEIEDTYNYHLDKAVDGMDYSKLALLYEALRKKSCEAYLKPEWTVMYLLLRSRLLIWASAAGEDGKSNLPDLLIAIDKLEGRWQEEANAD